MIRIYSKAEMEDKISGYHETGATIGFVPTMGALHEGHLSLIDCSVRDCDITVVSIFVNPTQFNDLSDLEKYPRVPEQDLALLQSRLRKNDIVFLPDEKEVYPEPDTRVFDLDPLDKIMEGKFRPGHFNGVAQVVSRLFEMVSPDKAYFGAKDFQQVAVVKKLVEILHMPVEIIACPVIRDHDGLAMSSRNRLLSPDTRAEAPLIYQTLKKAVKLSGKVSIPELKNIVASEIANTKYLRLEYFEVVRQDTLMPVESWDEPGRKQACIAVWAGDIRLIDNIELKSSGTQ